MIGRTIKNVRQMSDEEKEREGWGDSHHNPTVIELDDGSTLYPSRDDEGNGPGALFGTNADGQTIYVIPIEAS